MRNKRNLGILALVLTMAMLLSGCGAIVQMLMQEEIIAYDTMEYTRPDPQELDRILQESCRLAAEGESVEEVLEGIYAFYEVYDRFYTDYALADIEYSKDITDLYWGEEYAYCLENISAADAGLDTLYYALADSPHRQALEEDYFTEGFFDSYEGESLWDEDFTALMEQEAQLINRYNTIASQALDAEYYSEEYFTRYGTQMEAVFVELVALRQQIAAYAGYDSYPAFAYDMYHARDYTPAQTEAYFLAVGDTLVDLYRQTNASDVWDVGYIGCSQEETFRYVQAAARNMGGSIGEAFSVLEQGQLYDIGYGPNKYSGAFEIYLWSYYVPYIFMDPSQGQPDKLSFAHEFGHFVNDYLCYGSAAGTDVAEVHSTAMEYISLCYGESDTALTRYKMADSLCNYVEQAALGLFEQQVYGLTGEALTAQNVRALYGQICSDFGFDSWAWDERDYVTVTHFFESPMYIASYVISNDVALQIYQREQEQRGAGLEIYQNCLESQESYLLTFADACGLESPFAPGRLEAVLETFRKSLT